MITISTQHSFITLGLEMAGGGCDISRSNSFISLLKLVEINFLKIIL